MGRKTSVYLTDEVAERVKASGMPLPELIRRGLDAGAPEAPQAAWAAIRAALDEWWEYRNGPSVAVTVAREGADEEGRPPEPADPPAAPAAPPQGQSAPMERSEAPGPRTDPEPAPERKRKAPARRAAAAPGPIADEAPAPLAAAHALAESIGAPLKAASDLRPVKPLPEVTPGTVMFAEAGATPVVTYEVPPVPRTCPHKLNKGAWCKLCRMEA